MYAVFTQRAHIISCPQEGIESENFQLPEHSTMCVIPKHLWSKAIAFVWFYIEIAVVGVGNKEKKYQWSTFRYARIIQSSCVWIYTAAAGYETIVLYSQVYSSAFVWLWLRKISSKRKGKYIPYRIRTSFKLWLLYVYWLLLLTIFQIPK